MRPLHKSVKEASNAIYSSPWSHLTSNNPASMGPPSTLSSITSRTQPPRFNNRPGMSGSGNSYLGAINTQVPNGNSMYSSQPYSTASLLSTASSGYGTPGVPATPLSAALGAAAQATVPNTPNLLLLTDLAVLTFLSVQTDCLATQHGASNCSCNVQAKPSLLYYRFGVCISFGVCSRFSLNLVFISLHILASALSGFHSFAWHIDCIPYQVFEVI